MQTCCHGRHACTMSTCSVLSHTFQHKLLPHLSQAFRQSSSCGFTSHPRAGLWAARANQRSTQQLERILLRCGPVHRQRMHSGRPYAYTCSAPPLPPAAAASCFFAASFSFFRAFSRAFFSSFVSLLAFTSSFTASHSGSGPRTFRTASLVMWHFWYHAVTDGIFSRVGGSSTYIHCTTSVLAIQGALALPGTETCGFKPFRALHRLTDRRRATRENTEGLACTG